MRDRNRILIFALFLAGTSSALANSPQPTDFQRFFYADVADAVSIAPIVAVATITKSKRLKGELATGVPEDRARFLVTAKLSALIRGNDILPERIDYLVDTPLDARGRPPKLNKQKVILAATPVAGKPGTIRLISPRAQMDWSAPLEAQVRAISTEAATLHAPPRITGVGNAFHVRGTLPGESETQIFLKTMNDDPVSLTVLRRPGEEPRWAVALGEMIDDSARPPQRDTLLWYRLACFLPQTLPASSVADLGPDDAAAAGDDYRFIIGALGKCERAAAR